MNVKTLIAIFALAPLGAGAQGYADLGAAEAAKGFAMPKPGAFEFPEDHGPHPDFRIEWWYVTATLTAEDGTPMGLQWTLFRSALSPEGVEDGWASRQVWMAHAAVTTPDRHLTAERFARGGIGQAGVEAEPFSAHIDDWTMVGPSLKDVRLTARGDDFAYDVALTTDQPFVPQGESGYSVKSEEGLASRYYSQPFYDLSGEVTLQTDAGPRTIEVTGQAWLDREWSSQPMSENQLGWDWFSLHFEDDTRLMGYRMREADGEPYAVATWIAPDGTPTPYEPGAFEATPLAETSVAGRDVPTAWRVELPDRGVDVEVRALNPDAWMGLSFPYWEGPVTVTGSHEGRGYLEMTGYE